MEKIFTLSIASIFTLNAFAQGAWTQKAIFGGAVRDGAVGFSVGNKGYIGTGVDNSTNFYYQDFWEYDPVSNSWTQKADFGGGVIAFAVGFAIGNMGYIGTGANSSSPGEKSFWEYNPILNTWTQKTDFGGIGRAQTVGFSIGNKGFIGTGRNGSSGSLRDFWQYDPVGDTWTQKTDFGGTPRNFSVGFSIGAKGYIGTGDDGTFKNDFWEYDTLTNIWAQKANFGGGIRRGATGFAIASKGYIGTGEPSLNDFWEYNPLIDTWTQKASFGGVGRHFAVGFAIGTKGYIGTGLASISSFNDFWEYNPCSINPSICMVTVDSISSNNIIIWDKTLFPKVDSFFVLRETSLNVYSPIGAVPYDSLSLFVDTVRTKYFPNTGDPNAGTYRYKIQMRDSCGNYSILSPYHNTIYITNNSGTFLWPQLYTIEGASNPVANYVLMRDNNSTGNWTVVNSVTGSQQTVTDPQYSTYQSTAKWRVETQWSISCNPTRINPDVASFNVSRSNIFSNVNAVNEYYNNFSVCVYPNPTSEKFTVYSLQSEISRLEIYDLFGKQVFQKTVNQKQETVNLEFSSGMYFYTVFSEDRLISTGKLIIE